MVAFTWQNFVSAGTGIAVALALIRGLTRHSGEEVGNFWVDLTRACLWVLLPIAILMAVFFMSSGVIQTLGGPVVAHTLEGVNADDREGPGGVPRGHQDTRRKRRRLLQRELRASLREPDAADQLRAGSRYLRDTGRTHLHLRSIRRQSTPRVGALRGDDCPLRDWTGGDNRERAEREPQHRGGRRQPIGNFSAVRRQHGRQRGALRSRPARRCSPTSPPTPRVAPSTIPTTASRRSGAAWPC